MNIARHTIEINDMEGQEMTVEICAKFTRLFWIRYYVAAALMRSAGWVLNIAVNIETNDDRQ